MRKSNFGHPTSSTRNLIHRLISTQIMNDLHTSLTNAYNTQHAVMLPGSGTYAMEAAARAFGHEGDVVVVRNGYFSYRWSQLFECMGKSDDQVHVMKARPVNGWSDDEDRGVQPPPIEEVVAKIRDVKPSMVCAPHVETSAGIILNKEYCKAIGDACKEVGATFCLDGVASGTAWVDMDYANIGAYITAPQKGWSGPAAVGVCMMSDEAAEKASHAPSTTVRKSKFPRHRRDGVPATSSARWQHNSLVDVRTGPRPSPSTCTNGRRSWAPTATAATCTTRRCRRMLSKSSETWFTRPRSSD